jgi:hypothetical protein
VVAWSTSPLDVEPTHGPRWSARIPSPADDRLAQQDRLRRRARACIGLLEARCGPCEARRA